METGVVQLAGPILAVLAALPAWLPAQQPGGAPTRAWAAEVLAHHVAALGGRAALPRGGYRITAEVRMGGRRYRARTWVRPRPFAFRRELTTTGGKPRTEVWITDGRHAWRPRGAAAPGEPLPAPLARACLEQAFLDGFLYVDPSHIAGTPATREPWKLHDHRGLSGQMDRGLRTRWIALLSPAGTMLQFHFDARDGRLREVANPDLPPVVRWTRFGVWRTFGALRLATLRVSGRIMQPPDTLVRIEKFETGLVHDPALFAGKPLPETPPVQPGGELRLRARSIPGWAHLLLPGVEVNGPHPVLALVDTGAGRTTFTPGLAGALRLPRRGPLRIGTFTRSLPRYAAWIDRLRIGSRRALQITANVLRIPPLPQLHADRQPGMLLGGKELLGDSPVFDLAGGRLVFRGRPVRPLEGTGVLRIPLHQSGKTAVSVDVVVNGHSLRAGLDTGSAAPLTLSRKALARAGLPVTEAAWIARGALRVRFSEAGGKNATLYAVRLASFRLGPVVLQGPTVALVGLGSGQDNEPLFDVLLGTGALLGFARVGLDFQRDLLELEPGPDLRRDRGDTLEVAPPGAFLGLLLSSAPAAAPQGRLLLPTVSEVALASPAARAGLQQGDLIRAIDGVSCAGRPAHEVNRRLWLPEGGSVELDVISGKGKRRKLRLR